MKENLISKKSLEFAIRIVKLFQILTKKNEYVISKQILRSGTSIGANIAEAECGISRKDFLAKMYISFKECAETKYWLTLLQKTGYITTEEYTSIFTECDELYRILSSITKTIREGMRNEKQYFPIPNSSFLIIVEVIAAARIGAYLDIIIRANNDSTQEVFEMRNTQLTADEVFIKSGLAARWEARGEARGEAKGEARGEARGVALGKESEATAIAKNMIGLGLPYETVVSATKLDPEKVRELYKDG